MKQALGQRAVAHWKTLCASIVILGAGLLVLAPGGPARAETTEQLAARLQARQAKVANLQADYQRISRFVAVGQQAGSQVEASGQLTWAQPWNLRLSQVKPREQLVVANAQNVWWVRPSLKRADLYPTGQFTSGLGALMDALGGLASLEDAFKVEAASAQEAAAHPGQLALALVPKVQRGDLARLVLWFDPGSLLLKAFRMVSLVGDLTEYRLSRLRVNQALEPGTFLYAPPRDVLVRDHRPLTPEPDKDKPR